MTNRLTNDDQHFMYEGRVWMLGDDVDTDELAPFSSIGKPWEEVRRTLLPRRAELSGLVEAGDVLVAGRNFGCGSSREMAVGNLKNLGFVCVVADSFARIFFRNCVATAFPALSCPGITDHVEEGVMLKVDLNTGTLSTPKGPLPLAPMPYSESLLEILQAGGLMALLKSGN